MNYELLMQRCVDIGNSVLGHTYPNPNVGALIYKDGKIISNHGWYLDYHSNSNDTVEIEDLPF